ncbi:MAG: DNA methyltransferase [Ktedonobacteraceae bacterium]
MLYFYGPDAPPLDCPLLTEQFSAQEISAPDGRQGNRYHTWQKPDDLAERLIRHATRPGDLVYDVFSGTGTFLLAAQRLGRIGRGCECSEEMLALAEKRGCAIAR